MIFVINVLSIIAFVECAVGFLFPNIGSFIIDTSFTLTCVGVWHTFAIFASIIGLASYISKVAYIPSLNEIMEATFLIALVILCCFNFA